MDVSRFVAPLMVGAALGSSLVLARAQSAVPDIPEIPAAESPFFVLNNEPENPGRRASRQLAAPMNQYPLNKSSEQSASRMFTRFFTDMFSSVNLVKQQSDSKLLVEPVTFSLDERREVTVTYTVTNRTRKLMKLDFPTSQRIEILVRDGSGKVIEKWSDDRAFQDVSGVVMINPGERVQYVEKIATREMQPGQTYVIEASLANNSEFTKTTTVTPSAKPREAVAPSAQPTPTASPTPGA